MEPLRLIQRIAQFFRKKPRPKVPLMYIRSYPPGVLESKKKASEALLKKQTGDKYGEN